MLNLRPKGRATMPTAVPCKEEAELMTWLARSVGRFPKNRGTIAGSKHAPLVRLASVQSPRRPGFSGANSIGVESRMRFLRPPREQGGVHGTQCAPLGLPEETNLPGTRGL